MPRSDLRAGQQLETLTRDGQLEGFMRTFEVLIDERTGAMRGAARNAERLIVSAVSSKQRLNAALWLAHLARHCLIRRVSAGRIICCGMLDKPHAVCRSGSSPADHQCRSRSAGMVLEKLSGRTAEARMAEPGFADVRYVRAMLRQVLRAVHRAYSELGARPLHTSALLAGLMHRVLTQPPHVQKLLPCSGRHLCCWLACRQPECRV